MNSTPFQSQKCSNSVNPVSLQLRHSINSLGIVFTFKPFRLFQCQLCHFRQKVNPSLNLLRTPIQDQVQNTGKHLASVLFKHVFTKELQVVAVLLNLQKCVVQDAVELNLENIHLTLIQNRQFLAILLYIANKFSEGCVHLLLFLPGEGLVCQVGHNTLDLIENLEKCSQLIRNILLRAAREG